MPNNCYFCYDHFPPWNGTTQPGRRQRSHFPDTIDDYVDLNVWNNASYQQNVRRYCTSDQGIQNETTYLEIARRRYQPLNEGEDNIQQLGIQFTSLSVNNNRLSLTPSQMTRDGDCVGLVEYKSFAGPYTNIQIRWEALVQKYAKEFLRKFHWTDHAGNEYKK